VGRRRGQHSEDDPAGTTSFGSLNNSQDHSGYTGQEQLDQLALVHLNGRVYDPVIGRMISADPTVPNADDAQQYNRYTYVLNNGLAFIDPSGFTTSDAERRMMSDGGFANGISYADLLKQQNQDKQEPIQLEQVVIGGTSTPQSAGGGFIHLSMTLSLRTTTLPAARMPTVVVRGTRAAPRAAALAISAAEWLLMTPPGRVLMMMLIPANAGQNDPCQTGALCEWNHRVELTSVWEKCKADSVNAADADSGDKPKPSDGQQPDYATPTQERIDLDAGLMALASITKMVASGKKIVVVKTPTVASSGRGGQIKRTGRRGETVKACGQMALCEADNECKKL